MLGVLWIHESQQLTGTRNAERVIINANQTTRKKSLRPLGTISLRYVVQTFSEITASPTSHVNYSLCGARARQPYHLLDNLCGREIPCNIPIPHYAINTIR